MNKIHVRAGSTMTGRIDAKNNEEHTKITFCNMVCAYIVKRLQVQKEKIKRVDGEILNGYWSFLKNQIQKRGVRHRNI
jgi:hypothetical protein